MNYFLAKTDPKTYSIGDLAREKQTTWDGVRNPQAVIFLKKMQPGDLVLIYHSQGEAAIVGLAKVIGNSRPDPKDSKSWLVDFAFVKRFEPPFVTLPEIKKTGKFNDFRLVRQGRLSTMDVSESFISYLKSRGLPLG